MVNACGNVVFDISALGVGMRAIHYLIDCEGRALRSPFEALRPIIGRTVTEPALITHAIENLGYAHVLEWPQGLVVSYRRPVANAVTLAGAIYLLADLADKRVIFSVLDRHVRYALCRDRSQAIGRLAGEMRNLEAAVWEPESALPPVDLPTEPIRSAARRDTT
jgi:hypothetical protein